MKNKTKRRAKWKRLIALPGAHNGCLCCPPILGKFNLNSRIAIGFGYAAIECDGKPIWREEPNAEWEDCWTGRKAENLARKRRKGDWRIIIHGPMSGRTYQRHGKNMWVLVEKNMGFA